MDNGNDNKTKEEKEEGVLVIIALGVIGGGLLWLVDWIFGDWIAMCLISIGIVASIVGLGLSATTIYKLTRKLSDSTGQQLMQWWYNNEVPAQSPNRMSNPTPQELESFLRWKMEQEQQQAQSQAG